MQGNLELNKLLLSLFNSESLPPTKRLGHYRTHCDFKTPRALKVLSYRGANVLISEWVVYVAHVDLILKQFSHQSISVFTDRAVCFSSHHNVLLQLLFRPIQMTHLSYTFVIRANGDRVGD